MVVFTITLLQTDMVESAKKKKKPAKGKSAKPSKGKATKPAKPAKGKKGKGGGGGGKNPNAIFAPFTKPGDANCQCWWDLTRQDCGCCKAGAMQCGFPKHKYCWKKSNIGCPGVGGGNPKLKMNKFTLSEQGHPCHYDHSDKSCAWCVQGALQCGKEHDGQQCYFKGKKTQKYCESVIADCGHIGKDICDPNAECTFLTKGKGKAGKDTSYYGCKCKEGWNDPIQWAPENWSGGIQCVDGEGNFSQDPNKVVTASMTMTNEYYSYPAESTEFPYGPSNNNLFSEMNTFVDGGSICAGCEGTIENI